MDEHKIKRLKKLRQKTIKLDKEIKEESNNYF